MAFKNESIQRTFSLFSEYYGLNTSITDSSLSFQVRQDIADAIYPKKTHSNRIPKPKTPRRGPLPEININSPKNDIII